MALINVDKLYILFKMIIRNSVKDVLLMGKAIMKIFKNIAFLLTFICATPVYTQEETSKRIGTLEELVKCSNALAKADLLTELGVDALGMVGGVAVTALSIAFDATLSSDWTFWLGTSAVAVVGLKSLPFFERKAVDLRKIYKNDYTDESYELINRGAAYKLSRWEDNIVNGMFVIFIFTIPILVLVAASYGEAISRPSPDMLFLNCHVAVFTVIYFEIVELLRYVINQGRTFTGILKCIEFNFFSLAALHEH